MELSHFQIVNIVEREKGHSCGKDSDLRDKEGPSPFNQ
jgi:hypothetical protein